MTSPLHPSVRQIPTCAHAAMGMHRCSCNEDADWAEDRAMSQRDMEDER